MLARYQWALAVSTGDSNEGNEERERIDALLEERSKNKVLAERALHFFPPGNPYAIIPYYLLAVAHLSSGLATRPGR